MAPPRQVLRQQLEILVDFVEENKQLLKGTTGGSMLAQQYVRQKWTGIAKKLNAVETGALKTPDRWKKYWFEWRHKCKKKAADARRFQSGASRFIPLNDLEIRVLELSGKGSQSATDSSKVSSHLESFLVEDDDSDSQPLENIKVQTVSVKKSRPKRCATSSPKAPFDCHQRTDYEPRTATPPPKWALDMEERRLATEERMAAALESIASIMQSQEERRAMLDERIADAMTTIAGTVQDLNNGVQEALQHLHRINPMHTNGPDFKGNFMM